jgi:hypothetical protein
VVHDAAHLAQKTDHQRFRCLGPRTPVLQAAAQGVVEALSPVVALGGDQLGRLVVGNGRGIPCGGIATMWPMFRRLCAVADYLQPEFPDALVPAFIRRSPCNAVDELHILQCASP